MNFQNKILRIKRIMRKKPSSIGLRRAKRAQEGRIKGMAKNRGGLNAHLMRA